METNNVQFVHVAKQGIIAIAFEFLESASSLTQLSPAAHPSRDGDIGGR